MPLYWTEMRSLTVTDRDEGVIHARIEFTLAGTGEAAILVNDQDRILMLRYDSGPFTGTQRISVVRGVLEAVWDVKFSGIRIIPSLWDEKRLKIGTMQALENLAGPSRGQTSPGV